MPLTFGVQRAFYEKSLKGKKYSTPSFFYDGSYDSVLSLSVAVCTRVVLGSFCLIIPGIYFAIKYAFVPYVWADHPDWSTCEIMKKSARLTECRKMDVFVFNLSFIGWRLLGVLTLGLVDIFFTTPYQYISLAMLYRELVNEDENNCECNDTVEVVCDAKVEVIEDTTEDGTETKEQEDSLFRSPQEVTGGNLYATYNALHAQRDIDIQNANQTNINNKQIMDSLNKWCNKNLANKTINPYYLLQLQANYFCNTCKFETNNKRLESMIYLIIRGAFMFGRAGLYIDPLTKQFYPVYIKNAKKDIYGNYKFIEYGSLYNALTTQDGNVSINTFTITGDDCLNMLIFSWGTMEMSAWVYVWPFVQFQNQLLQMLVNQSFAYSKKFIYKVQNMLQVGTELEALFNPNNIFLISMSDQDLSNKLEVMDSFGDTQKGFIDYYNEVLNAFYEVLGRRTNTEQKKERNVTDEVEASQDNFDIVQSDYLNQFKLFIDSINNHVLKPPGLTIKVKDYVIRRVDSEQPDINDID